MAIRTEYIRVGELESYMQSADYREQSFYSISLPRARSHAHNPRSRKDDVSLILAYDEDRLVGYLGAIPEIIFVGEKRYKVCWYSCMWVLPEYRRSGIAKMLLEDASRYYGNLVLITNYIPRSKAAFLKNDQFREVQVLEGVRAYRKSDLEGIIPRKKPAMRKLKPLFILADYGINCLSALLLGWRSCKPQRFVVEQVTTIDSDLEHFIDRSMKQNSLFRRSKTEFDWLREFPWVVSEKMDEKFLDGYYFSQYSPDFRQWTLRITDPDGRVRGFALLTKHRRELKTPYILADPEIMGDLFCYIYDLMRREGIRTLITHSAEMSAIIKKKRRFFMLVRHSGYGFMATPDLVEKVKGDFRRFYDGDGDGMFT